MKKLTESDRNLLAGLSIALLSPALFAQNAVPTTANEGLEEEVLVLPEFSVKDSVQSEYLASESVTGTRVAVKIEDLPFSVNVVTSEFLNDFNLLEWKDQFAYVSNVGQSETQSPGYTLRGFSADTQLRNGFRRIGLIDKVNVDRVEVIKGPAASIYGAVVPGGAINVITRTPKAKPEYRMQVSAGNLGAMRTELSATGPFGGKGTKAYYRFDAAGYNRDYKTPFRNQEQFTAALQLAIKPSPNTSLLLEVEHLSRKEKANTSATIPFIVESRSLPWVPTRSYNYYLRVADESIDYVDSKTGTSYRTADLTYFSTQGPKTYANRWVKNAGLIFEHRFNQVWSLRTGGNLFQRDLKRNEVGSRDQYNPITNTVQRGTARYRPFPEAGAGLQSDLLASFETGSVKHKLLFTVDFQRATETPKQFDGASSSFFPTAVANGLNVASPDYNFITYEENPTLYGNPVSSEFNSTNTLGFFISERAAFFNERLNLMLGLRQDTVEKRNKVFAPSTSTEENSTSEVTYQLGLNYKLTKGVSLFASTSTSFLPQPGSGWRLTKDGAGFESFLTPNERGLGYEGGMKVSILDNRLGMTFSYFDIQREDVALSSVSVVLPSNSTQRITPINKERAKGYEFDFSWVLTSEFQVFGAYGYNDGKVEDSDVSRWMIGSRLRRAPKHNAGLALKYEFKKGSFKGLYLNAGYKYYGDSQANPGSGQSVNPSNVSSKAPFTNLRFPNGLLPFPQFAEGAVLTSIPYTILVPNGRERVMNQAYRSMDAGIGYKWRSGPYGHKVQFNASNLADVRYTIGSSAPGEPLSYTFTYELKF